MSKKYLPYHPWYWRDWFGDADVQSLDPADKSLWMEMLGRMWESEERGYLLIGGRKPTEIQLARLFGFGQDAQALAQALARLSALNLFSVRDYDGVIYSRRILRDLDKSAQKSIAGALGGNKTHSAKAGAKAGAKAETRNVLKPISLDIILDSSCDSSRREESAVPKFSLQDIITDIIAAGPVSWSQGSLETNHMAAYRAWQKAGLEATTELKDTLIASAADYRAYCENGGVSDSRYITSLPNFIEKRQYGTDWEAKNKNLPTKKRERHSGEYEETIDISKIRTI